MKFLKFLSLRKEKTTEELFKKCEKSFSDFCSYIHLAHTRDFHEFKKKFANDDVEYCIDNIIECKDDELKRKLINHLQKQIDFLRVNSFGPNSHEKFQKFLDDNYPYEEKVDEIISKHKFEQAVVKPLQAEVAKQKMKM